MTADINKIILELEELDPAFKEHREEAKKLLVKLLERRPDVTVDDAFVRRLRAQITKKTHSSRFSFMLVKPLTFSLGAVGVFALLLFVATQLPKAERQNGQIIALSDHAFGSFGGVQASPPTMSARPMGGGGSPAMANVAELAVGSSALSVDTKMMVPADYTIYTYAYTGELPALTDTQLEVYRRAKGFGTGGAVNALKDAAGGMVNLGVLSNTSLQAFTLLENREFGYSVSVDPKEGSISFYQNYLQWPQSYDQAPLTAADVPSDEETIKIANDFMNAYSISQNGYGTPFVQSQWRNQNPVAMNGTKDLVLYAPDVVNVIYPLTVNGAETYDESGNPQGLSVNVNVRHKKVDSMWNLNNQRYETSKYDAVTDTADIKAVLGRGGLYSYPAPEAKKVELQVGEPTRILMRTWLQSPDAKEGSDVYVPALRFPVTSEKPQGSYIPDAVVVPLVKELINNGSGGVATPLMLR